MDHNFEINSEKATKPQEPGREKHSIFEPAGQFIWDLAKVLLLALIIIIPIRYFLFQPFIVSGSSMEPNFSNGDYLVIDEVSYRFDSPERGDVIVMRFPNDLSQFFIKRIVGLPGEKVIISNGKVQVLPVNSTKPVVLEEEYLPGSTKTEGNAVYTLGEDEYFVLGDNREASSDSRSWGVLPSEDIIGRAWIKLLPLRSISVISGAEYSTP